MIKKPLIIVGAIVVAIIAAILIANTVIKNKIQQQISTMTQAFNQKGGHFQLSYQKVHTSVFDILRGQGQLTGVQLKVINPLDQQADITIPIDSIDVQAPHPNQSIKFTIKQLQLKSLLQFLAEKEASSALATPTLAHHTHDKAMMSRFYQSIDKLIQRANPVMALTGHYSPQTKELDVNYQMTVFGQNQAKQGHLLLKLQPKFFTPQDLASRLTHVQVLEARSKDHLLIDITPQDIAQITQMPVPVVTAILNNAHIPGFKGQIEGVSELSTHASQSQMTIKLDRMGILRINQQLVLSRPLLGSQHWLIGHQQHELKNQLSGQSLKSMVIQYHDLGITDTILTKIAGIMRQPLPRFKQSIQMMLHDMANPKIKGSKEIVQALAQFIQKPNLIELSLRPKNPVPLYPLIEKYNQFQKQQSAWRQQLDRPVTPTLNATSTTQIKHTDKKSALRAKMNHQSDQYVNQLIDLLNLTLKAN